jgi:peptidoglycan/xylan/chitin deacetylase (PgdA/CDA1 family)
MWARHLSRYVFHHCGGMQTLRWLRREGVTILVYHKFPADHSILQAQCEYLRRFYQVISLAELAWRLRNHDPLPRRTMIITVDDGHRSFFQDAYPVFAGFGFPVTVYLTTGPIDNRGWLWFDRIAEAFLSSPLQQVDLPLPFVHLDPKSGNATAAETVTLGTREQRLAVAGGYMERMKLLPNRELSVYANKLEAALGVRLPDEAPPEWASVTWDEVRSMAREGHVEFGGHSVSHPILTRLEDSRQLSDEIMGPKRRIETEVGQPVLHFAYPNGQPEDVSSEVVKLVREAGYETAATTRGGQVFSGDDPFLLRRVPAGCELTPYQFRQQIALFNR